MLDQVYKALIRNPILLHPEESILKVKNTIPIQRHYHFPVVENNKILGVVTLNDLLTSHPNRIVADSMSFNYSIIEHDNNIWFAKELFQNKKTDVLVVTNEEKIIGILTESHIDILLSKYIDSLTGLYKSNYIYYCSNKLLKKDYEISYIFLDIDKFGAIDKKYGHIIGDDIIKDIANLIKRIIPKETYLCRFAGDEFLILTPYRSNDSISLAQKIITTISDHSFINKVKITITAGISSGKSQGKESSKINNTIKNLINLASLTSSEAKKRNCSFLTVNELGIDNNYNKNIMV